MINEQLDKFSVPSGDTIIWKYMDIPSFISLIQDQKIVFNKAKLFEDKNEGKLPLKVRKDFEEVMDTLYKEKILIKPISYSILEDVVKVSYVCCWSISNHEIVHMWKIYAKENGIAIKTSYNKLKESLKKERVEDITPLLINYIDYNEAKTPLIPHAAAYLSIKREEYKYENEFRLVITRPKHIENMITSEQKEKSSDEQTAIREEIYNKYDIIKCDIDLTNFIDEIRISPFAPSWYKDIIKNLLVSYNLSRCIPLKQSDL